MSPKLQLYPFCFLCILSSLFLCTLFLHALYVCAHTHTMSILPLHNFLSVLSHLDDNGSGCRNKMARAGLGNLCNGESVILLQTPHFFCSSPLFCNNWLGFLLHFFHFWPATVTRLYVDVSILPCPVEFGSIACLVASLFLSRIVQPSACLLCRHSLMLQNSLHLRVTTELIGVERAWGGRVAVRNGVGSSLWQGGWGWQLLGLNIITNSSSPHSHCHPFATVCVDDNQVMCEAKRLKSCYVL